MHFKSSIICCCFPWFSSLRKKSRGTKERKSETSAESGNGPKGPTNNIVAQAFTFRELATATKNFRKESQLGEGGFGKVYKGKLAKSGRIVAVKQLDRKGLQGNKEFLVEVLMLSQIAHSNLVNLIGYCADGDQRLLVYEYMSSGSLEDHIFDLKPNQKPLDWYTRMKIALGAAKGLHYLHEKATPPVIYRDLKSSNILLNEHLYPKLSDFGLAKLGPLGGNVHVSTRVMGTYGYCAPEYQRTGHLTVKSDVYSFGVVFLELITGRRTIDTRRPSQEQNLVIWAQPYLNDPKQFKGLADPTLGGQFPLKGLNQAAGIAAMCLQDEEVARPMMSDVVVALSFLTDPPVDEPSDSPGRYSEPSPSLGDQTAATVSGSNNVVHSDEDTALALERKRALAEAMEWGQSNAMARAGNNFST